MVCFVDNILWGCTDKSGVINRLGQIFTIGFKFFQAFNYLGIEIHQNNNKSITIDRNKPQTNKLTHRKGCKNTITRHFSNTIFSWST